MVRVSVLEFAVEAEVAINLARALRLIDAAVHGTRAQLIVLPSGLDRAVSDERAVDEHAADTGRWADPLATAFARALSARAARHGVHLVFGQDLAVSGRTPLRSMVLVGPRGELLGSVESESVVGGGGEHSRGSAVFATAIGNIALCLGEDLASFASARLAALEGADVLCASYAAGDLRADDDHPSARALENGVHVVCASGLFPAWHRDARFARSRIVANDGRVLSEALAYSESVLSAELSRDIQGENALRGPLSLRRPEIYRGLEGLTTAKSNSAAPRRVSVAAVGLGAVGGAEALERAVAMVKALAESGVALVVLPALLTELELGEEALSRAARWFLPSMRALAEACYGTPTHVVTTVVEAQRDGLVHHGVVLGHAGIVARRMPSHLGSAFQWSQAGKRVETVTLPWGRLGMALPEELYVPELGALWARSGAEVIAVPEFDAEIAQTRLLGRQWAREHGMVVVAASRAGAAVESASPSVELGIPTAHTIEDEIAVVVRKVRIAQPEHASASRPRAGWQRPLWTTTRFTPSLVEAILSKETDTFATLHVVEILPDTSTEPVDDCPPEHEAALAAVDSYLQPAAAPSESDDDV